VRFNAPKVLFEHGSNRLRSKFMSILDSFFPRYIGILQKYQKDIIAVRIEGHTSSDWNDVSLPVSYLNNVRLSQQRALSTLECDRYLIFRIYRNNDILFKNTQLFYVYIKG